MGNTIFAGQPARLFSGVNIHHRKMESIADNLRERALFGINAGRPLDRLIEAASKLLEVQIPGTRCIVSLYDEQRDVLVSRVIPVLPKSSVPRYRLCRLVSVLPPLVRPPIPAQG